MKTIPVLIICLFVTGAALNAQKPVTVKESDIQFKHGSIPGFIVTIPEVPKKTIEDAWVKILEKGTKSTVQRDFEEMTIFGAIIKDVAGGPINVYSYIKQSTDSVVTLAVAFELKKDEYLTSASRDFEAGKTKDFLFKFAKDHYLELAKDQMQVEEKKLRKIENNLSSLQNEKNRLERKVQSDTTSITETKQELVVLRANLESLNSEHATQSEQLNAMSNGAAKDEKRKYIADLDKRIKKTNNDISANEKKLATLNADLDTAKTISIPNNIKEQEQVTIDLYKQKVITDFYINKFNTISAY